MRPIGASLSRYYYSRMGKGCQHLRHINFQTVATLPTLGTPPGFTNCIPHRHCNHCDQQPTTITAHGTYGRHLQPTANSRTPHNSRPTAATTAANTWNPIHPSSRGGRVDAVDAMPTVPAAPAALPMLTVLPPALPLPPHRITACHPTPQHDTNTPPPPHGRSGQDITGVAVEEEGGGFPMWLSA